MPKDIHFHAKKSVNSASVNLELWKGVRMLGMWVLTPEQAWDLSAELIEDIPEAPPETEHICSVTGCKLTVGHLGVCER